MESNGKKEKGKVFVPKELWETFTDLNIPCSRLSLATDKDMISIGDHVFVFWNSICHLFNKNVNISVHQFQNRHLNVTAGTASTCTSPQEFKIRTRWQPLPPTSQSYLSPTSERTARMDALHLLTVSLGSNCLSSSNCAESRISPGEWGQCECDEGFQRSWGKCSQVPQNQ